MSSDQYVITTLLRAERDEAYAAIRAIWEPFTHARRMMSDEAGLPKAILEATQCLPPELRTPEMPPVVDRKTTEKMQAVRDGAAKKKRSIGTEKEVGFDDILG